jgi:hypothetical protein
MEEVSAVGSDAAVEGVSDEVNGSEPVNPVPDSTVEQFLKNGEASAQALWNRKDLGDKDIVLVRGTTLLNGFLLFALATGKFEADIKVDSKGNAQARAHVEGSRETNNGNRQTVYAETNVTVDCNGNVVASVNSGFKAEF